MYSNIYHPITWLCMAALMCVQGCAHAQSSDEPDIDPPSSETGSVYGIDVSHHQGKIDWSKVSQWREKNIQFVYIKATEGATYSDPRYKENIEAARANEFLTGSYHYFRTSSEPKDQFKNFLQNVNAAQQDLIPLVDVEEMKNWKSEEFHEKLQEFLDLAEDHYGRKPMIYTVNTFYNKHLKGRYERYPLLIGRYGSNPPLMLDKTEWTIWQFTEEARVEGIEKAVDIDVLNSTIELSTLSLTPLD